MSDFPNYRRSVRGIHSRGDPHAKGRFHGQEVGGWGKNFESKPVLEAGSRSAANDSVEEHDPSDMQVYVRVCVFTLMSLN